MVKYDIEYGNIRRGHPKTPVIIGSNILLTGLLSFSHNCNRHHLWWNGNSNVYTLLYSRLDRNTCNPYTVQPQQRPPLVFD